MYQFTGRSNQEKKLVSVREKKDRLQFRPAVLEVNQRSRMHIYLKNKEVVHSKPISPNDPHPHKIHENRSTHSSPDIDPY